MATSFQSRRIDITFTLSSGTFDGKADIVKLTKLRVGAEVNAVGGLQFTKAKLRIYGLSQELMNRLTVLTWRLMSLARNTVRVEAGTNDDDMSTVFFGDIYNAMADYQGAPDAPFIIDAGTAFVDKLKPVKPSSFPGTQPVSRIMQQLAKTLKATLENNGVNNTVTDQYLSGTVIEQIQTLAKAAEIDHYYEPPVLAICPRGRARSTDILLLNENSGLVGWPSIDRIGVALTALYNPAIIHGGKIKVESSVKPANGEFYIYSMSHSLSSETPSGPWFTHIFASEQNNAIRR